MRWTTLSWVTLAICLAGCNGGDGDDSDADDSGDTGDTDDTDDTGVPSSVRIVASVGGQVQSPDGVFTLLVPAGAIAADTDFSITVVPQAEWPEGVAALEPIGEVYDVQPDGLVFVEPAYAVHRWTTTPAALRTSDGDYVMASHYSVAADGTIEQATTTQTWFLAEGVGVVSTLAHLSESLVSPLRVVGASSGAATSVLTVSVEADAGEHAVGEAWRATKADLTSEPEGSWAVTGGAEVYTESGSAYLVPEGDPGSAAPAQTNVAVLTWMGWSSIDVSALHSPVVDGVSVGTGGVPVSVPYPGWRCTAVGEGAEAFLFAGAYSPEPYGINEVRVSIGKPPCVGAPDEPDPDATSEALLADFCDAERQGPYVGCVNGRGGIASVSVPTSGTAAELETCGSSVCSEGLEWLNVEGPPSIKLTSSLADVTATHDAGAYTITGLVPALVTGSPDSVVVTGVPLGGSVQDATTVPALDYGAFQTGGVIREVAGLSSVMGAQDGTFDAFWVRGTLGPLAGGLPPTGESAVRRIVLAADMAIDGSGMRTAPLFDPATLAAVTARGQVIESVLVGPLNFEENDTLFPGHTVRVGTGRFVDIPVGPLEATAPAGECVAPTADLTRSSTQRVSLCYESATSQCGMQHRDTCTSAVRIGAFYDQTGPNFTFYTTSNPILPIRSTTHGTIESSVGVVNRVVGLPLDTDVTITLGVAPLSIGADDVRFTFRRTGTIVEIRSIERVSPP